jgi:hypothetical protein
MRIRFTFKVPSTADIYDVEEMRHVLAAFYGEVRLKGNFWRFCFEEDFDLWNGENPERAASEFVVASGIFEDAESILGPDIANGIKESMLSYI